MALAVLIEKPVDDLANENREVIIYTRGGYNFKFRIESAFEAGLIGYNTTQDQKEIVLYQAIDRIVSVK